MPWRHIIVPPHSHGSEVTGGGMEWHREGMALGGIAWMPYLADGVSWHAVPAQIGGIESSGIEESIFSSQCKVQSTIV